MVQVLDRPKATVKEPKLCVGSASLLRHYRKVEAEEETIETKIRNLETRFEYLVQSVLRSQLVPKDSEEIANLSQASLSNIVTIKRLLEQIQEAGKEG